METFDSAQRLLREAASSFGCEEVDLHEADNRFLAVDIVADRDYPPFNRAAMDGYAFRIEDWHDGIRTYEVVEVVYAGAQHKQELKKGQCYKIMTGAACPERINVIIKLEDAIEVSGTVSFTVDRVAEFQHIARQGEDVKQYEVVLYAPQRCNAQIISLLASLGVSRVSVYLLPSVSIVTTGSEVIQPDLPISPFQIRNSNQFLLRSLLKKWSIVPQLCTHVDDNVPSLQAVLREALKHNITIINGGVSVGDADYVPTVLGELGVKVLFHKVSIKPGKPILVGQTTGGGIVFALPGNPLSCLVTFTVFVEEYLYYCFQYSQRMIYKLPVLDSRRKKGELTEFFPVKIHPNGGLCMLEYNGSGDITAALGADGFAIHPHEMAEIAQHSWTYFYPL
ncbi:molybdopterin molybdotransferase MoeA [Sphingobacterium pedocola]|uniref:Molybdopterin molybdenumtransferase n=1 Tax=Sphingobacterium pedocola TaxID=2082722 RepID=A0ABR9T4R7_9SPHI|nr:molybdopterin molybdotransferase MoeA [Sphingobacterium pedocola]MBE8720348.1 molybdopterin molybdenumtransferase MoeA [Sphingobacterium pedocola]